MFAVISFQNQQYKVEEGKEYRLPNFDFGKKKNITFDEVLLVSDSKKQKIGSPNVEGAEVSAEILGSEKGEKVEVLKYKPKKRYRRNIGQRQKFVRVKIKKIKA